MDRIPILKVGSCLLVSIQIDMADQVALNLEDDLSRELVATGARGVLIDISCLDMVDSFIGRVLSNIADQARILGAQTVVVGMQPAVAITLVELGLNLEGIETAINVDLGMAKLAHLAGNAPDVGESSPADDDDR
ncbi:MAG: STAS domain-containing protein [Geothermobacteraceae bacterium]